MGITKGSVRFLTGTEGANRNVRIKRYLMRFFGLQTGALFSADAVSSPVVATAVGDRVPSSTEDYRAVFAATAAFLRGVFGWAKRSQIAVAIGTEMPLLKAYPAFVNKSSTAALYKGIFKRIAQTTPDIDYYWMCACTVHTSASSVVVPSSSFDLSSQMPF